MIDHHRATSRKRGYVAKCCRSTLRRQQIENTGFIYHVPDSGQRIINGAAARSSARKDGPGMCAPRCELHATLNHVGSLASPDTDTGLKENTRFVLELSLFLPIAILNANRKGCKFKYSSLLSVDRGKKRIINSGVHFI